MLIDPLRPSDKEPSGFTLICVFDALIEEMISPPGWRFLLVTEDPNIAPIKIEVPGDAVPNVRAAQNLVKQGAARMIGQSLGLGRVQVRLRPVSRQAASVQIHFPQVASAN